MSHRRSPHPRSTSVGRAGGAFVALLALVAPLAAGIGSVGADAAPLAPVVAGPASAALADPCGVGGNVIACENSKPGTPASEWDIDGAGDDTHSGLRDRHQRQRRISRSTSRSTPTRRRTRSPSTAGLLRRRRRPQDHHAHTHPPRCRRTSRSASPTRPPRSTTAATGRSRPLERAGTAVSGVYVAKLDRGRTTRVEPHPVRRPRRRQHLRRRLPDLRHDLAGVQQLRRLELLPAAANGRAYKISYNRPFRHARRTTAATSSSPTSTRWSGSSSATGTTCSYIAGVDTDRAAAAAPPTTRSSSPSGTTSTGAAQQRANVEAARDAGVNLQFLSGNEVYWRTRCEPSADGTNTPYRTLVCYKETWAQRQDRPVARVDRHLARPAVRADESKAAAAGERPDRHHVHRPTTTTCP